MITRIVRLHFQEDKLETFRSIFQNSYPRIRDFPGCHKLELMRDPKDPTVLYTFSLWESDEHLQAYRKSELFGSVWPRTKALFAGKPEAFSMERVELTE